jgi:hypothetical protein
MPHENQHFAKDKEGIEDLREKLSSLMKRRMIDAISKDEV